jgi:hypothetical protein
MPPEKIRPYLFHGLDLNQHLKDEWVGDCFLCDKPGHLYVNSGTGQWNCRRCNSKGNIYTWLAALATAALRNTSAREYKPLVESRGIPLTVLKTWGLAKSPLDDHWLLPTYNAKGAVTNLYSLRELRDKRGGAAKARWLGTAALPAKFWGLQHATEHQTECWLTEGPWDAMHLMHLFGSIKRHGTRYARTADPGDSLLTERRILALAGCQTFPDELGASLLPTTILCFDNDHPRKLATGGVSQPAWDGIKAFRTKHPDHKLRYLKWNPKPTKSYHDPDLESGYDLSDLCQTAGLPEANPATAFKHLSIKITDLPTSQKKTSAPADIPTIEPLHRETFDELLADLTTTGYHVTPNLRDTFALSLATVASTELPGEQIWLRIIGPPGSGKTTIAEAITAAKEYVFPISIQTGFHSGHTGGPGGGGGPHAKDASLVKMMDGKTVLIKDGDTLLTAANRDKTLAELRDLYDGVSRAHYRNGVHHEYENLRTTFILCGTDHLRTLNRSFLGERFLDCEILGAEETDPYIDRAIENAYLRVSSGLSNPGDEIATNPIVGNLLKAATYGYVLHLKKKLATAPIPSFPEEYRNRIKALAKLLAYVRARLVRTEGELDYRPRVELATRLASQFTKLAVVIAVMFDYPAINGETYRLLQKIMVDTATSFEWEMIRMLVRHRDGLSSKQLANLLNISHQKVYRCMADMQEFDVTMTFSESNNSGDRGRNIHLWRLQPPILAIHDLAFPQPRRT